MRLLFALVLFAACSKSPDAERCERGVGRVFDLTTHPHPKAKPPGAEEQAIIDQVVKQTKSACEVEGLSEAQLDCLLAMKSFDDMKTIHLCPAIKAKHPSWLIAGPSPMD